uniref:Zinc finger protein 862 n=1 Tax=Nothobranchius pienaari TaxID=704102 RepID=A0A1A8M6J0_9TELE
MHCSPITADLICAELAHLEHSQWLEYSKAELVMYCVVCRKYATTKSSFVEGTNKFKLEYVIMFVNVYKIKVYYI